MRKASAPTAILVLLTLVGVALALVSHPRVKAYDPPPVERHLYAAYPFSGDAKLMLANSTMREVTIAGKLYSPDGQMTLLEDVLLPAHAQKIVDLDQQIATLGTDFQSGGIELEFYSADPGIAAQLLVRDGPRQQPMDIPLKAAGAFRSPRLEGLWFVPAQDAQLGLMLHNRGAVDTTATVTISRQDGAVLRSRTLTVPPHNSRALELQDVPPAAVGGVGGISIQYTGAGGTLLAVGFVQSASQRISTAIPFVDPTTLFGSNIYGAGAQLGNTPLAQANFTGHLLLRNLHAQAVPVTASLQCGETRTALISGDLGPGQARRLAVPSDAVTCETGAVGVEVTSPVKGSLLGRWLSVGASGLVVETAIHSVSPKANISGSDPWLIDEETASILYVQNTGTSEAEFVPIIQYSGHSQAENTGPHEESYMVGQTFVKPGETVAIDIRKLRDQQTPDVHGRVLPADLRSGLIHWLRGSGPALVASVTTVNAARRIASTFSFFCCYCSPRHIELRISPQSVSAEVGQVHQMQAYEDRTDCHNVTWPVLISPSQVNWGSSNPYVASVDAAGQVYTGPFPGTATIVASKWVIESYPDTSIGDGDPCYLDDYCYGSPQCLTDEWQRYASASFDVSPPPPPPPPPTVSLSCTSQLTRGQNVSCNVSVQNAGGASVSYSQWRFTDGSATVNRPGNNNLASWSGTMVTGGTVSVRTTVGSTVFDRSTSVQVNARSWHTSPPSPVAVPNGTIQFLPVPPQAVGSDSGLGIYQWRINSQGSPLSVISDSGPNHGYAYYSSAPSFSELLARYTINPDLENAGSEFSQNQCGNYNANTNPGGFISWTALHTETRRHEYNHLTQSHHGIFANSLNSPSNNLGDYVETRVARPGADLVTFNNETSTEFSARILRIEAETAVEPFGVNRNEFGTFLGNINYAPYTSCN